MKEKEPPVSIGVSIGVVCQQLRGGGGVCVVSIPFYCTAQLQGKYM